jgi:hypothetical protein
METNNPLVKELCKTWDPYISFLSQTDKKFWSSENTVNDKVTCSRDWVAEWELFQIKEDSFSGKQLLRSDKTHQYASIHVKESNSLKCDRNSAVIEAQFTFDMDEGTILASNDLYVTNPVDGGPLSASSSIPVNYDIFYVIPVRIGNVGGSRWARLSNGKIALDSPNGDTFYLLTNEKGVVYFETGSWQFVDAHNNAQNVPVSYAQTRIDANNYRLELVTVPVKDSNNLYSFKMSAASDRFLNWGKSSEGEGGDGDFLYCNASKNTGSQARFSITLAR